LAAQSNPSPKKAREHNNFDLGVYQFAEEGLVSVIEIISHHAEANIGASLLAERCQLFSLIFLESSSRLGFAEDYVELTITEYPAAARSRNFFQEAVLGASHRGSVACP